MPPTIMLTLTFLVVAWLRNLRVVLICVRLTGTIWILGKDVEVPVFVVWCTLLVMVLSGVVPPLMTISWQFSVVSCRVQ